VAWNRVREHEGELDFASAIGQGSTFKMTLPRRPELPLRRDSAPEPVRRPTRRRPRRSILVVDSSEGARELIEAVLKADHWVRAVATGAEAIKVYDAPRAFDYVVLTDDPRRDGLANSPERVRYSFDRAARLGIVHSCAGRRELRLGSRHVQARCQSTFVATRG